MIGPRDTDARLPVPAGRVLPIAPLTEIWLVLGVPVVVLVLRAMLSLSRDPGPPVFTSSRLAPTLAVEAGLAALLLPLLRRRGWTPAVIAGQPGPMDIVRGALLWLGAYVAFYAAATILVAVAPSLLARFSNPPLGHATLPIAVLAAVLNPLFEEFLWLGYAVSALSPRVGLRGACTLSIALRTAVHVYQGPAALPGIAAWGIALTLFYAKSGRLWPVVVAHVIADATAFGSLRY